MHQAWLAREASALRTVARSINGALSPSPVGTFSHPGFWALEGLAQRGLRFELAVGMSRRADALASQRGV